MRNVTRRKICRTLCTNVKTDDDTRTGAAERAATSSCDVVLTYLSHTLGSAKSELVLVVTTLLTFSSTIHIARLSAYAAPSRSS